MSVEAKLPSLSIVIPSFDGRDLLEKFLPDVLKAAGSYRDAGGAIQIVVVEDGGTDGTPQWLAEAYPEVEVVRLETNHGFPRACNRGFAICRHALVMLLNNDVRPERFALVRLARRFTDPRVFAATCMSYEDPGGARNHTGKAGRFRRGYWSVFTNYESSDTSTPLISAVATGGFSMFDRRKLEELGGFDELYSPYQYEDFDLSYRAWKRGWMVLYEPDSVVHHRVHTTIDRHYTRRQDLMISRRNRLMLHWKNLHSPGLLAQHIVFVVLQTLAALVTFNFLFIESLGGALRRLPAVLRRRRQAKRSRQVSDVELKRMFHEFLSRPGIRVYWDREEMEDYKGLRTKD